MWLSKALYKVSARTKHGLPTYLGLADIVYLCELWPNRLLGRAAGHSVPGDVVAEVRSAGGALGESLLGQAVAQRNDRKKETPQRLFEIHHQETERNLRG